MIQSSPSRRADVFSDGQVAAGLRLGHADAPRRVAGEDAGQELGLLVGPAEGDQRRAHLAVGEPHRGDRRAGRDELLGDDQPVDRRAPAAAELGRPRQADPAERRHLLGELVRVAVDPRVVVPPEAGDRVGGHLAGLLAQGDLFRGPVEVHHGRWYDVTPERTGPTAADAQRHVECSVRATGLRGPPTYRAAEPMPQWVLAALGVTAGRGPR